MRPGLSCCFLAIILFSLFGPVKEISYGEGSLRSSDPLITKFHSIEKDLENSSSPVPFHLESFVSSNASRADVYGVIKHPFLIVGNVLRSPVNWCGILLLHDDVRACTYKKKDDAWQMTVYEVNKFDESLEHAYQMNFVYRLIRQQPAFLDISLASPGGPFGTTDHQFRLEAIPLEDGTSFIHLAYSFHYSPLAYFGMNEYLAIFDGGKVGFTIRSIDQKGNPVYIDGLRGVIERNTVRYYLALLAYMDSFKVPLERRFEERIGRWYDLTALFKRQLFDLPKEEYLVDKRQDRENQQLLQSALGKQEEFPQ